jgi:hypothetical protein
VLCGVSPLVWRRLLVAGQTGLAELHGILQTAFDWSGEHLHRFLIHGAAYGIPCLGGIVFREDARRVPLSRFRLIAASVSAMNTTSWPCSAKPCWRDTSLISSIRKAELTALIRFSHSFLHLLEAEQFIPFFH